MAGITALGHVLSVMDTSLSPSFDAARTSLPIKGVFIGDLLERERAAKGDDAAKKLQVRLLESDHLEDALAGLTFLRTLSVVDRKRVAVVGHSFGGSLALLVAERDRSMRAAVNFAGAAGSWEGSADQRERLITAVGWLTALHKKSAGRTVLKVR